MDTIYFAGGCFWGTQHYMSQFDGVIETETGYANGSLADPSYQQVYTDRTGHVECVKVVYDRELISLGTLCRLFFRSIDPLLVNRQGDDCGTRYRTGIYWTDDSDREAVEKVYEDIRQKYNTPLAVEKCPLKCFYAAEEYHQDYLVRNPDGYCHLSPEIMKSAALYSQIIKELRKLSDEEKKIVLPRFFKTGKGEYGEGDRFIGVTVPNTRKIARQFKDVSLEVIEALLESEWHECRLCALLILIENCQLSCVGSVVAHHVLHQSGQLLHGGMLVVAVTAAAVTAALMVVVMMMAALVVVVVLVAALVVMVVMMFVAVTANVIVMQMHKKSSLWNFSFIIPKSPLPVKTFIFAWISPPPACAGGENRV